jgi:probable rRNA maturation factor
MRKTLAAERAPVGALSVALVGNQTMQRINREYRGSDRPTDVLSFSYVDEPHAGGVLGEIYVSPSMAAASARETGCAVAEEIVRLTLHGILHILGYDHDTPRSRRRMLNRQERYLDRHYLASQPTSQPC